MIIISDNEATDALGDLVGRDDGHRRSCGGSDCRTRCCGSPISTGIGAGCRSSTRRIGTRAAIARSSFPSRSTATPAVGEAFRQRHRGDRALLRPEHGARDRPAVFADGERRARLDGGLGADGVDPEAPAGQQPLSALPGRRCRDRPQDRRRAAVGRQRCRHPVGQGRADRAGGLCRPSPRARPKRSTMRRPGLRPSSPTTSAARCAPSALVAAPPGLPRADGVCYTGWLRVSGGNNSVVECDLAKVEVAGSNPVSRSIRLAGASQATARFAHGATMGRSSERVERSASAASRRCDVDAIDSHAHQFRLQRSLLIAVSSAAGPPRTH